MPALGADADARAHRLHLPRQGPRRQRHRVLARAEGVRDDPEALGRRLIEDGTRAAVERYLDALNAGDVDRVADCVTEDFHNEHTSTLGHGLRGRDAYRERLA